MAAFFVTTISKLPPLCSKLINYRNKLHVNHQRSFCLPKSLQCSTEGNDYFNYNKNLEMTRSILSQIEEPLSAMAAVDLFQQLGIDYHFSEEIKTIIDNLYEKCYNGTYGDWMHSLHDVALFFRLLRQDGYYVSPEIFDRFMDKKGHFQVSLSDDLKGMLNLYEASYFDMGEEILFKANEFSTKHLKASIKHSRLDAKEKIKHSLEHPIHTSLQRYNVRHNICLYKGDFGMCKMLKELAIVDINKLQSLHKSEYLEVLRWWENVGLSKQPQFFRNQPMKWFMWSMTMLSEPQFSKYRVETTKVIALVYVIDDIFDVLGSFEELVLFTKIVERWENLPNESLSSYMKICYNNLYSITNDIANLVMREHGWNPIDLLRKLWLSLCKAFLAEAQWLSSGNTPKAQEYLKNAVTSTGAHVTALILRLWDDLGSAETAGQEKQNYEISKGQMRNFLIP